MRPPASHTRRRGGQLAVTTAAPAGEPPAVGADWRLQRALGVGPGYTLQAVTWARGHEATAAVPRGVLPPP